MALLWLPGCPYASYQQLIVIFLPNQHTQYTLFHGLLLSVTSVWSENFSRTLSSSMTNWSRDIIISRFQDGVSLKVTWRRLTKDYQKSVREKFWYCLGLSQFTVKFFDCMHLVRKNKLWLFLQLLDLRYLDLGSGHMAYRHVALIDLYLHTKFPSNRKNFCKWTDVRILRLASLGWLILRVNLMISTSYTMLKHIEKLSLITLTNYRPFYYTITYVVILLCLLMFFQVKSTN